MPFKRGALARVLPFALFIAFIAVDECARLLAAQGWINLSQTSLYYLYPLKTIAVAALLYRYLRDYTELSLRDLAVGRHTLISCALGLLTFVLWISMDWTLGAGAEPQGFNPNLITDQPTRIVLTLFRVAGAVLVVPLMEELFWRSFLLRYLIDANFESVPIGRFSWASFLVTVLLFGLEHHFILAGMVAGAIYSMILYKTRSIAQCVLAHAVTNLALAGYVLYTGRWHFW